MAPLPSLAPSLWGAASPFTAALNSMRGGEQHQPTRETPVQIQSAVFAAMNGTGKPVAAAPAEPGAIKMYSPEYYMTCALGGVVSCGATHTAVTPLVSMPEKAVAVVAHVRFSGTRSWPLPPVLLLFLCSSLCRGVIRLPRHAATVAYAWG